MVLAGCDSRLHIIDVTESGKEIDSVDIDAPTGATAAMHDGRAYSEGGTFYAISIPAAAGKKASIAWKYQRPATKPAHASGGRRGNRINSWPLGPDKARQFTCSTPTKYRRLGSCRLGARVEKWHSNGGESRGRCDRDG